MFRSKICHSISTQIIEDIDIDKRNEFKFVYVNLTRLNKLKGAHMANELDALNQRLKQYKAIPDATKEWYNDNFDKIKQLFNNKQIRDFVFEPFKNVFYISDNTIDRDIYSVITQVAVINAVLAGLPGQLGVGISVSIAFEAWMAYGIAKHIGVQTGRPMDIY